jgi:hypothetical protein
MIWVSLCLVAGLVLAHLVGRALFNSLAVSPGHARRIMPTVPFTDLQSTGVAGEAFAAEVRAIEARLLERFEAGVEGVYAEALAGELQEPVEWVEVALDRLRQEVPCRLRVTQTGRMLHDFEAADVHALRDRKRRAKPLRLGLFVVALCANVGTVWPVVTLLVIAGSALGMMASTWTVAAGALGLSSLVVVAVATVALGSLLHVMLSPMISGPKLGPSVPVAHRPKARTLRLPAWISFGGWSNAEPGWLESPNHSRSRRSSSSSSSSGDSSGSGQAILFILVAIVLIAVIAACLSTLAIWVRGLYRSVNRVEDLSDTPPSIWVRTKDWVDTTERLLPTTDLVGRIWRALRRALSQRRPLDWQMGPRILARAQRNGGTISAIEIALQEGLDPFEAVEAGARLTQQADGSIVVLAPGELGFTFPATYVQSAAPPEDENLWSEYLVFDPESPTVRRALDQSDDTVPVNLVGLREGHLVGSSRLVAGSCLMVFFMALLFVTEVPADWAPYLLSPKQTFAGARQGWGVWVVGATTLFAICAMLLAAAARYIAVASAHHGVRRDARRAAYQEIFEHLQAGSATVDLDQQAHAISNALHDAWPGMPDTLVAPEMLGVAVDLELEPTPELGEGTWSITELRTRYTRARAAARAQKHTQATPPTDDPVVFDTQIELDRLVNLA